MKRTLFVVNPVAGQKKIKAALADVLLLFNQHGIDTAVYMTDRQRSLEDYIENRGGDYDSVVCCGGDGTLNRTVNGIINCNMNLPIGYIPAGSTNDFAAGLKLPSSPISAAEKILQATEHLHDVGVMDKNRNFVYVASFGAFSETSYMTSQSLKNALGHLAYILDGSRAIINIKPISLKCSYDGGETEGNFIFGAVANSTSMGGILKLKDPKISFNDGLFEMLLVRAPKNIFELQGIINCLLTYKYDGKNVIYIRTSAARFQFEREIEWSLDGERYIGTESAQIDILKKKISFLY